MMKRKTRAKERARARGAHSLSLSLVSLFVWSTSEFVCVSLGGGIQARHPRKKTKTDMRVDASLDHWLRQAGCVLQHSLDCSQCSRGNRATGQTCRGAKLGSRTLGQTDTETVHC